MTLLILNSASNVLQSTCKRSKNLFQKFWNIGPVCIRHFGQPASQTHPHLIAEGEVTPGITKTEFHQRRCNLVKSALKMFKGVKSVKNHLFVFPSATTTYMTNDIPFVFRQNTDFLYFSGFQEPDSLLLIEADSLVPNGEHTSVLFVPQKDPAKELWDGPKSGVDGALTITGVDVALNSGELGKYLSFYLKEHENYVLWYEYNQPVHSDFHRRVFDPLVNEQKHKFVENTSVLSHRQRVVKSAAEIQLMQKSVEVAAQSFIEVMKFSKPQVNEAHLWAKMDFECRMRGAEFLAYPPVVAGGPRANIIHYITNNQKVDDGQMILMDAGCERHGYTSDLTRTWPVSGHFTEPQKKLYNAALRVQEACIRMCTTEYSLDEIFQQMLYLLAAELSQLHMIAPNIPPDQMIQLVRKFCPHHVSHYLGMDVHDTSLVSRRSKLQAGMVVTVEPGIYVGEHDWSVSPEFRGIGIRIEDDILVTSSEPINLSASCPKAVEEIESLLNQKC